MNRNVTKILKSGTSFLAKEQLPDGSFKSFSSSSLKNFRCEKTYRSIFPSALILACLNTVTEVTGASETIEKMKQKTVRFLLAQKSEHWSFNYWERGSEEAEKMPYPDDLDDTFCALSSLYSSDPSLVPAESLTKIVSLLTFNETREGGPYRTWLVPEGAEAAWIDTDLAVNANVAYFLSLQDVDLPEIVSFVEEAIIKAKYVSPYYPSLYPIAYFISRFYSGPKSGLMQKHLLKKQKPTGAFGNPLETALAVSALLRLGSDPMPLKKSIAYLLKTQASGEWKAEAFCMDPSIGGRPYYAGSSALTAAFCLEALALYIKAEAKKSARAMRDKKTEALKNEVIRIAKKKFSALDTELQKEAIDRLERTVRGDKDNTIILLPSFFASSLGSRGKKIPRDLTQSLCLANLYGWMAYTIYDDFLDDEGDPKLLSLANVCLRELTGIFRSFGENSPSFSKIFTTIMDKLDSANAWEVAHCRVKNTRGIPDYGNFSRLAERSLGHALGPLAILCSLGRASGSHEIRHAKKFFEDYLVARQLNDDAHDWEKDLKMGHINAVGAMLFCHARRKTAPETFEEKDIAALQKVFWNETIDMVAEEILARGKSARTHLKKMQSIQDTGLFEKMLLPVENAAKEALREKERTLAFLEAY